VEKRVMNVRELAQELRISVPTAYEVASRADFPSIRVSERRIVIPVAAFNVWLDKQVADKIGNQI
jgi:predicted DNA-binding transcriptional regulator AlpA